MLPGYVGADIAALCREAAMHAMHVINETKSQNVTIKITIDDFVHAMGVVVASTQRGSIVDFKKTSWEDIGGLEDIKQVLA
jgi:transitional endoplasmic reticulum ATPase